MSRPKAAAWTVAVVLAAGCAHRPYVHGLFEKVDARPGTYVGGEVDALAPYALLDDRDFVYTLAFAPGARRVAVSRLGGPKYVLGRWRLRPTPVAEADVPIGEYEWDVEGLAYSPDGKQVVAVGRDGSVRAFDAQSGALVRRTRVDEPAVSVAFAPDGALVAVGGARGTVSLLAWPSLALVSEARLHADEVRALAFGPDGALWSGGWDKTLVRSRVQPETVDLSRVELSVSVAGTGRVVQVGLDGLEPLPFAIDASLEQTVITTEVARGLGAEPSLLPDTVKVRLQPSKVAHQHSVWLKTLRLQGVDLAVCDDCVPKGLSGVLGQSVLGRFDVELQPTTQRLVLVAKTPPPPAQAPVAKLEARFQLPAYVNDFSVDRSGTHLGAAFSHDKAERTRAVYEREKKGQDAPASDDDFVALLDARSGAILQRWHPHRGVVSTATVSPDGRTVASGGWDKRVFVFTVGRDAPCAGEKFGWSVRRVRFSDDGLFLGVAAWTPENAVGDQRSDPSAVVYELRYRAAQLELPGSAGPAR